MDLYREVRLSEDTELKGKEWDKIKKVLDKGTTIERESVCYWRKFNALHKYFADNFGGENDNCTNMYLEIDDIIKLRDLLKELSEKIKLGKGLVPAFNRYYDADKIIGDVGDNVWAQVEDDVKEEEVLDAKITHRIRKSAEIIFYKAGIVVKNPEVCEKVLPTTEGFFFGTTDYDEWYAKDVKETVKMLDKVIAEHDELTKTVKEYNITYYYRAWY